MAKNNGTKSKKKKKKDIREHPAFEQTRENMAEFGRAARANRVLRCALRESILQAKDRFVSARLTKRMARIIYCDDVHSRGERVITQSYLRLLEGFNFNHDRPLTHVLFAPYEVTADRAAGRVTIHFPFFNAHTMTDGGTQDYELSLVGALTSIDFEREEILLQEREYYAWNSNDRETRPFQINLFIPPGFAEPLIIALGVVIVSNDIPDEDAEPQNPSALSIVKVIL